MRSVCMRHQVTWCASLAAIDNALACPPVQVPGACLSGQVSMRDTARCAGMAMMMIMMMGRRRRRRMMVMMMMFKMMITIITMIMMITTTTTMMMFDNVCQGAARPACASVEGFVPVAREALQPLLPTARARAGWAHASRLLGLVRASLITADDARKRLGAAFKSGASTAAKDDHSA
jgi:hypothetical protein